MSLPENPITREEQYLSKIAGQGFPVPDYPITREEQYLDYIAKHGGGGGGGTSDYNDLDNKPKINGVELSGNKTTEDLHITGGSAELTDDLTTAIEVGGIEAGTEYAQGTSLETIVRDLLEPTLYPTLTAPSATLAGTGSKLIEYGNTVNTTLTASFNRGSINPAYGTSGYRSGEVVAYTFFGRYDTGERFEQLPNSPNTSGTLSYTVDIPYPDSSHDGKANLFQCFTSVQYSQGEQPKDSKGNDYDNPLPAGSVQSANMSAMTGFLEFWAVNAMWANTANIGTVAKLSLVNNNTTKQRDMVFPAQTVANPEVFDIPASWNVTAVQVKNDLSGAWEDASSQFTVTDTTHPDAGNNTVNYKRYTFNMGVDTGARQIRVKWS